MVDDQHRVREEAIEWEETSRDEAAFRRKRLGSAANGDQLGCSLYEIPPGASAWPYHYHTTNEEAIYVLSGEGELRTPEGTTPLTAGEYVAIPTGEDGAHRVSTPAEADEPLRYLCVSMMDDPDVLGYPDSEKIGVYTGTPPGGDKSQRLHTKFFPADADVDFWEGE